MACLKSLTSQLFVQQQREHQNSVSLDLLWGQSTSDQWIDYSSYGFNMRYFLIFVKGYTTGSGIGYQPLAQYYPCKNAIMCQNWAGVGQMKTALAQFQSSSGIFPIWVFYQIFWAYLSSYPGYFQEPHWFSMGLLEISRVTVCWDVDAVSFPQLTHMKEMGSALYADSSALIDSKSHNSMHLLTL